MPTKLGQNFLINESIAERIAKSADLSDQNILEIGPGKGMLTKYLAEHAKKVLAVEIDEELADGLRKKFASRSDLEHARDTISVKIVNSDILKLNLPKLTVENNFQPYKLVANLPYYITSKIIRLFLETKYPPEEMILMVQKEVGERIAALDGKESLLSISVKFYAEPEILFPIPRENFNPVPEVDSVVIKIRRKNKIPAVDVQNFFSLVHAGFASKRKTLENNLSAGLHISKTEAAEIIKKSGIDPGVRAEKLIIEDWLNLYKNFFLKD